MGSRWNSTTKHSRVPACLPFTDVQFLDPPVEPRLGVGLVLAITIASSWPTTHFGSEIQAAWWMMDMLGGTVFKQFPLRRQILRCTCLKINEIINKENEKDEDPLRMGKSIHSDLKNAGA